MPLSLGCLDLYTSLLLLLDGVEMLIWGGVCRGVD